MRNILAAIFVSFLLTGCGGDFEGATPTAPEPTPEPEVVEQFTAHSGRIVIDTTVVPFGFVFGCREIGQLETLYNFDSRSFDSTLLMNCGLFFGQNSFDFEGIGEEVSFLESPGNSGQFDIQRHGDSSYPAIRVMGNPLPSNILDPSFNPERITEVERITGESWWISPCYVDFRGDIDSIEIEDGMCHDLVN